VAGEQCSVDDVLRDHRLAEALGRDEHDVARVAKEVEPHGGFDRLAIDARRPCPVEVRDGLEPTELAAADAALEALLGALPQLSFGDVLEELDRTPSPLGGERDEVIEFRGSMREADGPQCVSEGGHGFSLSSSVLVSGSAA
jgi:hypothetical protein